MALLHPYYLDSVVSIGITQDNQFHSLATGYLAGFLSKVKRDGQDIYVEFLVTNRHVFEKNKEVTLRFNLNETGCKTYKLILVDEKDNPKWLTSVNPKIDIAIITI